MPKKRHLLEVVEFARNELPKLFPHLNFDFTDPSLLERTIALILRQKGFNPDDEIPLTDKELADLFYEKFIDTLTEILIETSCEERE